MAMRLLRAAVPGALLLSLLPGAARADMVNFTAQLAGEADSQTTAAAARGAATVALDTATKTVHWRIEYSGLSQPPHAVGCGELTAPTGPAIWQTDRLASPVSGDKTLTAQQAAALAAGRWVCIVDSEEADIGGELKPAR
jgi:hypothetical protein